MIKQQNNEETVKKKTPKRTMVPLVDRTQKKIHVEEHTNFVVLQIKDHIFILCLYQVNHNLG